MNEMNKSNNYNIINDLSKKNIVINYNLNKANDLDKNNLINYNLNKANKTINNNLQIKKWKDKIF